MVTRTDGTYYTARMSAAEASSLRAQPGVRIVEEDRDLSLSDGTIASADSVTGLDAPSGADGGDVIPGRFIVRFSSASAARVASRNVGQGLVAAFSHAIDGFVADLSAEEYDALADDPAVESIEPDRVVTVNGTQANPPWGLDRIDQRSRPLDRSYSHVEDGTGVTAYVVDTGIRATHTQFAGRVRAGFTAVTDGNGTSDCNGHGTHVAGTLAGSTYGVAKNATLVPVRVLACSGSGTWSGVIAGLNWIVGDHTAGMPAVANMSIGGGYSPSVNAAVAAAVADGVTVTVAAGNDNANSCSYSPSGEPTAVTVGAVASDDNRASFSNFGSCLDLFAPGVGILSSVHLGDTAASNYSGTSMAAPHVAGVAALYLQREPAAAPSAVARALALSATQGAVGNAMAGSPNRLLYMGDFAPAPPAVPSVPGPPVATAGDGQVSLAWAAPTSDGGSPVTGYVVSHADVTLATTVPQWSSIVTQTRAATVGGLVNGRAYAFRVAATNAVGTGEWTPVVNAYPVNAGVPTAPRSLTVSAGRQSAVLYWASPLSNNGSAVTDYVVEYQLPSAGVVDWTVMPDPVSSALSTTLTNLSANVTYVFRVRAVNARGTGVPGNTATASPTPLGAPTPVRNLGASPQLQGAYVAWTVPLDNGGSAITGYTVDWTVDGTTWSPPQRLVAAARAVTLFNLKGGTSHTVRVRAVNQYGTSPDVTVKVTPVAPTVPASPRLTTLNTGYNYLAAYWTGSGNNGGSPISGQFVEWSTDGGATWSRTGMLAASTRSVPLSGLIGGSPHMVRVRAVNSVGESDPSNVMTAVPLRVTPPSEPRYLTVSLRSPTLAQLAWTSPLNTNGSPVVSYDIHASTDGGVTWVRAGTTPASLRSFYAAVVPNNDYLFAVTANNAVGASAKSGTVVAKPRSAGVPTVPTGLTASVAGTTVNLSWNPSTAPVGAPVTDYVVEVAVGTSSVFAQVVDPVTATTGATVSGLVAGTQYAFRVKARNKYGDSPYSAVVTATARAVATVPGAPQNVEATAGDARVGVSWDAPMSDGGAAVVSYTVTATVTAGGAAAGSCVTVSTSCIVSGLANGVDHSFTVRATNSVGTGPASTVVTATPHSQVSVPVPALSWGLDRIDQRALPLDSLVSRPNSGTGVTAYVIDTGIKSSHPEFSGRLLAGFTAVADGNGTNDCNGHGTHVAGTVAGSTYGVANGATLVPVRVLDCSGSGSTAGVIDGINWMINHHQAGVPAVANLSLGGGYSSTLNDAVARAVADGIVVVVAAGNSNADACGTSPASASSAVTVAASTSSDYKASYSNHGACVDLFAPGSSIVSAGINSSTATLSGTSMASPHVAGAAAVILANARALTPSQVADRLRADSTTGVLAGVDPTTTNSLLYLAAANVASLTGFESDPVDATKPDAPQDDLQSHIPGVDETVPEDPAPAPVDTPADTTNGTPSPVTPPLPAGSPVVGSGARAGTAVSTHGAPPKNAVKKTTKKKSASTAVSKAKRKSAAKKSAAKKSAAKTQK